MCKTVYAEIEVKIAPPPQDRVKREQYGEMKSDMNDKV